MIVSALAGLQALPESVVRVGQRVARDGDAWRARGRCLPAHPCERIVLELTEHARIDDYAGLERALNALRFKGVTLAIDDAGAGYSGLQQIVRLRPDILKLDMSLTRDIDTDPAKRSLAAAMVHFARETRAEIVAEGIETVAEMEMLRSLGVHRGQGYLLGKPQDRRPRRRGSATWRRSPGGPNGASAEGLHRDHVHRLLGRLGAGDAQHADHGRDVAVVAAARDLDMVGADDDARWSDRTRSSPSRRRTRPAPRRASRRRLRAAACPAAARCAGSPRRSRPARRRRAGTAIMIWAKSWQTPRRRAKRLGGRRVDGRRVAVVASCPGSSAVADGLDRARAAVMPGASCVAGVGGHLGRCAAMRGLGAEEMVRRVGPRPRHAGDLAREPRRASGEMSRPAAGASRSIRAVTRKAISSWASRNDDLGGVVAEEVGEAAALGGLGADRRARRSPGAARRAGRPASGAAGAARRPPGGRRSR